MIKKLRFFQFSLLLLLLMVSKEMSAQIIFSENWSSNSFATNGWTFPNGQATWGFTGSGVSTGPPTGATAPSAFFIWPPTYTNYSYDLVSPVINAGPYPTSAIQISYKLKYINFSLATSEQLAVEYRTTSSPSWSLLTNYTNAGGNIDVAPSGVALPGMAGQSFQIRFRVNGPNSFNIWEWSVDDIVITAIPPCTGTPNAGTALTNAVNPVCPGTPITLSLGGTYAPAGNLSYEWYRSNSPLFTSSTIIGNTNPLFYIPPPGTTTYYRCKVVCNSTGLWSNSIVSGVVIISPWSPLGNCWCVPTYAIGGFNDYIANVSLTTSINSMSNNTAASGNPFPYYVDYTGAGLTVPNMTVGVPSTISITYGPDATNYGAVWVDYNHNGAFDTLEYVSPLTNAGPNGTHTFNLTPPGTSLPGNTRLRVRGGDNVQMLNNQACGATNSPNGQAEDYLVNIQPAGPFDLAINTVGAPIGNNCTDSNMTLTAQVCNYGNTTITTTATNSVTVLFKVYGPSGLITYPYTFPIGTTFGAFGAGCQTVSMNPVNMFAGGNYYINAVVGSNVGAPWTSSGLQLVNDSLANAIPIINYRPTAGAPFALCQYSNITFGQGLTVSGCSAPIFDSVTITFTITGPCVDNIGSTGNGTSAGLPANASDQYACNFANGILPTLPLGTSFYTDGLLTVTNLNTAVAGSWGSEMRMNIFGGSSPVGANLYSPGLVGNPTNGASSNFTYSRIIPPTQLSTIFSSLSGGSSLKLGYWESYNDNFSLSDIGINAGGTTVAKLKIYYQYVPPAFQWYDVPTGGVSLYSLSPFNPLQYPNSVVNNSNVPGDYTFYAACLGLNNCRVPVKLSVKTTPIAVQDSMMACEYAVGANNAIFDLPTRNSIVSGGLWPAANVEWYGDQWLLIPVATPTTDTSSTNVIYSRVFYTYGTLQCATSDTMSLQVVSIPQYSLPIYTGFACAPSAIDISSLISIFPPTGNDTLFFNDPLFTSPYTGNPHAINVADTLYMIVKTSNSAACKDSATAYIDVLAATNNIANQDPGNFSVCGSVGCGTIGLSNGNTATLYTTTDCRRIATVTDDPTDLINLGNVSICQDIDCAVGNVNGQPYVNRHYEITPTTNGKAQVCLYYLQQDFDDYNSAAFPSWPMMDPTVNLCINQVDNGDINTPGHTAISIPNAAITSTYDPLTTVWTVCFPVDSFSYFYCATCNDFNIPLPVSLLSFEGKRTNGSSVLNWATSSEQNNSHFIVERSKDGKSFSALSSAINSKGMNGNSNVKLDYTHTDDVPMKGHNYYRLRQVDIDGHYSYSGTVDVYFGTETFVTMYPNPVNTELTVDITTPESSRAQVKIMDATGRVVRTVEMSLQAGSNSTKIDMQSLTDGMYMVSVSDQKGLNYTQTIRKK